ncbi:MAG: M20 family metallopeptidase, partial [Verrucomicrobia bacterium]|nr:M20 family metallopeptidase [Verrucomicrobiota bacterium]
MSDVVDVLAELVACPSVTPNWRKTFTEPYGEMRLAGLLAKRLSALGADVQLREVLPGRPNLVAHFAGRRRECSLMLEAHSDTVQVEDMAIPPFDPVQKEGRLYGRGACDTKGSMAAMLVAVERAVAGGRQPPVDLFFVSTCDEEISASGACELMRSGFRPSAAIVGEPTDLNVCHAHKGVLHWEIEIHGAPAHSSMPERGVSAIYPMAVIVRAIETQLQDRLKERAHALLGCPTVSVGVIHGGTQANIVPSLCRVIIDRRLVPGEDIDAATAEMQTLVDEVMVDYPRARTVLTTPEYYPPLETAVESGVARLAFDACQKIRGEAKFVIAPWASNAGVFARAGVPSVLFGPGSIRQAHTS